MDKEFMNMDGSQLLVEEFNGQELNGTACESSSILTQY